MFSVNIGAKILDKEARVSKIVVTQEMPKEPEERLSIYDEWCRRLASKRTGVYSMAFAEEMSGQTVTMVYFEEAVAGIIEASLMNRYSFFADCYCKKNRERALNIALSAAGRKLFFNVEKLEFLREFFHNPSAHNAVKIGSGSEGDVYIYLIDGREYAAKIFSEETQKEMEEAGRMWRMVFHPPDFSRRLGFTQAVLLAISDFPKRRCSISAVAEYAASPSFFMMERCSGPALSDLFMAAGIKKSRDAVSEMAREFLSTYDITSEALLELKQELSALDSACTLMRFFKIGFLGKTFGTHDLDGSNFIVRGFDRASGTFDLVLIDQGQDPPGYYMECWMIDAEKLDDATKCFERLSAVEEYGQYLSKYSIRRPEKKDLL